MVFGELNKWRRAIQHNGVWRTIKNWWFMADIKAGNLVGKDNLGNRYYQNLDEVVWGRDRWVDLANKHSPREASFVPPEWHAWLHRYVDTPPSSPDAHKVYANRAYFVFKQHQENLTGTDRAYRPYSTVPPKIQSWDPNAVDNENANKKQ